jgi:hypothetical protein
MRIRPAALVRPRRLLNFGLEELIEAVQIGQVLLPEFNKSPSRRPGNAKGRVPSCYPMFGA